LPEREGLRDRAREAPGLDQVADLGERVDPAAGGIPAAERHPVLLRAIEVGDRHDELRAARELDELGQDGAPGDVERRLGARERRWSSLAELAVPITRAPRARASWTVTDARTPRATG
jgi:hypothetical protein